MKNRNVEGYVIGSTFFLLSLLLPTSFEATAWAAGGMSSGEVIEHQVVEGDSFSLMAGYYYKDPRQWRKIYSLNSDSIDDPNVILPGTTVKVAADLSRQWDIPYRDFLSRVFD